MEEPLIGQVMMFGGNFAPRGWAFCDGQLLAISSNDALFSILGTIYGGDGRTTFALPDLRGRVAIQQGAGPGLPTYNLGQRGGNDTTTLMTSNLPATQVSFGASDDEGTGSEPSPNSVLATPGDDTNFYSTSSDTSIKSGSIIGAQNQAYSNMGPSLGLNYIIALQGIYPSRS